MNSQDPNKQDPSAATDAIATRARELFERASARLPVATGNQLRLRRRDARAKAISQTRPLAVMPMAAAAAAMLAIGLVWWLPREHGQSQRPAVNIEVAQDAYIDDEDFEVFAWLGEAPVATDDGKAGAL